MLSSPLLSPQRDELALPATSKALLTSMLISIISTYRSHIRSPFDGTIRRLYIGDTFAVSEYACVCACVCACAASPRMHKRVLTRSILRRSSAARVELHLRSLSMASVDVPGSLDSQKCKCRGLPNHYQTFVFLSPRM